MKPVKLLKRKAQEPEPPHPKRFKLLGEGFSGLSRQERTLKVREMHRLLGRAAPQVHEFVPLAAQGSI